MMSKNISDTIEIMASFSNNYDRNKHKRALKKPVHWQIIG